MLFHLVANPQPALQLSGEMISATVPLAGLHWEREVALVVDLGEKRTAGYGVKVTSVNLHGGDQVDLTVEVTRPGPGQFVAQVLTRPFALCKLPRLGLRPGEIIVTARDQSGAEVGRQVVHL